MLAHLLKRYWAVFLGVLVTGGAVAYWVDLQGRPEYVAARCARALFSDPEGLRGVPWQIDEMEALGITEDQAVGALVEIKRRYLPDARIASFIEFYDQTGKDSMHVKVEAKPGVFVTVPISVINEGGRGVVQYGDLVMAYRYVIMKASAPGVEGIPDDRMILNGVSDILFSKGIPGYYNLKHGEIEPWVVQSEPAPISARG